MKSVESKKSSSFEGVPTEALRSEMADIAAEGIAIPVYQLLHQLLTGTRGRYKELSAEIDKNSNLEKILTWTKSLLLYQGKKLKAKSGKFQAHLRTILRNIKRNSILDSVRENEYTLEYLSSFRAGIKRKVEDEKKEKVLNEDQESEVIAK